ncbi:MAG TPA: hypothetical protein PLQ44_02340 [Candidatus Paceibacterota bacterium]|mgnify:CR=1 FL=1|nr:hypothetical protein [Candidatus Paceibacterota bacterium]HPT40418.1 hypothetical protein [Candidatus Paceibacterota bacterium]
MNFIFNSKNKIGLFILTSALIIAGILVFYDPQAPKKSLADLEKEGESAVEGFNIKKENEKIGVLSSEDLSALLTGKKASENLTQKFADNLAKGFIDSNPSGIEEGKEVAVPDSQTLLDQIAAEQDKSFDSALFVTKKDLKISTDNSQQNILSYYESYKESISKYAAKMNMAANLEMFMDTNNPDYLKLIPGYLQNIIDDLMMLKVPSDLSSLHQDAINLFITEKGIFESLANVNDDPLKAASSLMAMDELFDEFSTLDSGFAKVLKSHGFEIQYQ